MFTNTGEMGSEVSPFRSFNIFLTAPEAGGRHGNMDKSKWIVLTKWVVCGRVGNVTEESFFSWAFSVPASRADLTREPWVRATPRRSDRNRQRQESTEGIPTRKHCWPGED